MKKTLALLIIVAVVYTGCTLWVGPVKLGSIGNNNKEHVTPKLRGPDVPTPVVSGAMKLEFTGIFGNDTGIRSPWGISFGVDGTLYVCDRQRSSLTRLDSEGNVVTRFSGNVSRVERLYAPTDVCSSAGMAIYAIDAANARILRFDRNLKNSFVVFRKDSEQNRLFSSFNGLTFDKISGDLYVTDRDTGALIRIDMLGKSIRHRGEFGSGKESFKEPAGIDVDLDGGLYIADKEAGAVAYLEHFSAEIAYIGGEVLRSPVDVAVLPDGVVAVASQGGVVLLSKAGEALGRAGFNDDRGMVPRSVAYHEGRLYISDELTASILVYEVVKE